MKDEGLHEVQLNGKQLVFAFMVATVIAVVVFLLGVLVGRGLRPTARADITTATTESTVDPTLAEPSAGTSPSSADAPVSTRESLDYAERLESPTPLPDDVREPAPAPAPRPPLPTPAPAEARPPATTKPAPVPAADPSLAEPAGPGFVVQVMAVNTRTEADTVARRLAAKGYPAFVTTAGAGARANFRVRVGKFNTQREAEAVSLRLQKEEQFKPWVTR